MKLLFRFALLGLFYWHSVASAEELGRLFFSPAERLEFEHRREQQLRQARQAEQEKFSNRPVTLTVNGLVQRSNGERTVWINGVAQHLPPGGSPNQFPVLVQGKKKILAVKVGETMELEKALPKQRNTRE
ncbi:MAG: hypothetical protein WC742_03280 [Gallionellaceae bacterium]|jgi:hypothetical protein